MSASRDERDRILNLIEEGRVTADQAAQLLDALDEEHERSAERARVLRVRVTALNPRQQRINMAATLPLNLVRGSLRLGTQLLPQLSNTALEDLLRAVDRRAAGRLLDLQDLDKGERLEIFVE